MKVEIKSIDCEDRYEYWEETEVYIDGKLIGAGGYQGCPEDRCRTRDFSWVEPLLKKLAESLGGEVTITKEERKFFTR